jgi:small subunit ribosomal protein S7
MSRRISTQKRFPKKDFKYNNLIVSLLINKILKHGKKRIAWKLLYNAFHLIENRIKISPILVLEKAIRNISPRVQSVLKRYGKTTHQTPILLNKYRATQLAIRWIIEVTRKRSGKTMTIKLANELLDAYKGVGNLIKKKEATHKYAESNKAYAKFG